MKLTEAIEESNPVRVSLSILGVILAGIAVDWMLSPFPVKWITPLVAVFCYLGSIAVAFMKAEAEEKGYKVEQARLNERQAIAYAQRREKQIGEANKMIEEANAKLSRLERIERELERVKQSERTLATKLTNANEQIANANQELANVDQAMTNASKAMNERIRKEVANATKALANEVKALTPYREYYALKLDYDAYRGVINSNKSTTEQKGEAKEKFKEVKAEMAEYEERL